MNSLWEEIQTERECSGVIWASDQECSLSLWFCWCLAPSLRLSSDGALRFHLQRQTWGREERENRWLMGAGRQMMRFGLRWSVWRGDKWKGGWMERRERMGGGRWKWLYLLHISLIFPDYSVEMCVCVFTCLFDLLCASLSYFFLSIHVLILKDVI